MVPFLIIVTVSPTTCVFELQHEIFLMTGDQSAQTQRCAPGIRPARSQSRGLLKALPLEFLYVRVVLRQNHDAPPVGRLAVEVEGQMVQLHGLVPRQPRDLAGAWDRPEIKDPQEVSGLMGTETETSQFSLHRCQNSGSPTFQTK